jgi:hypothetical protein
MNTDTPSEWQQRFLPNQTRDCIHGRLARSCQECDNEKEIFDLKRELTAACDSSGNLSIELAAAKEEIEFLKSSACEAAWCELWKNSWKTFAQHLENCGECALDIGGCHAGTELRRQAIDAARQ